MLPCELALKQKCFDSFSLTLSAMRMTPPSGRKALRRLAEHIVPWWCANIVARKRESSGDHGEVRLHFADEDLLKWRRAGGSFKKQIRVVGELVVNVLEHYEAGFGAVSSPKIIPILHALLC